MRGNRGHGELDDRHEVDEAFWAQAAADRATGRDGEEDASKHLLTLRCRIVVTDLSHQPKAEARSRSTLSSSTMTTMVADSTMYTTAKAGRLAHRRLRRSRICSRRLRVRRDACVPNS